MAKLSVNTEPVTTDPIRRTACPLDWSIGIPTLDTWRPFSLRCGSVYEVCVRTIKHDMRTSCRWQPQVCDPVIGYVVFDMTDLLLSYCMSTPFLDCDEAMYEYSSHHGSIEHEVDPVVTGAIPEIPKPLTGSGVRHDAGIDINIVVTMREHPLDELTEWHHLHHVGRGCQTLYLLYLCEITINISNHAAAWSVSYASAR